MRSSRRVGTVLRVAQSPPDLKRFNVTVRRFDPAKGLVGSTDFVLPVDSPDEEHAASAGMSSAVSFTCKVEGGDVLSVA